MSDTAEFKERIAALTQQVTSSAARTSTKCQTLPTDNQHWKCCECGNVDVRGHGDPNCFFAGCKHKRCDNCVSWADTPPSISRWEAKNSDAHSGMLTPFRALTSTTLQKRLASPLTPRRPSPSALSVEDVTDKRNWIPPIPRQVPSSQTSSKFVQAIAEAPSSSVETQASPFPSMPLLLRRSEPPSPTSIDATAARARTMALSETPNAVVSIGTDVTAATSSGLRRRPLAHTRDEEAALPNGDSSGQTRDSDRPLPALPAKHRGGESTPSPATLPGGSDPDDEPSPSAPSTSKHKSKRLSLWLIWAAIVCISVALLSLVILTFATANALSIEKAPSSCPTAKPKGGDPEFLYAVQNCGWQVSNILAGLIPACIHAHHYHKWSRMIYAWVPATICIALVVVSVPLYLHSPAISTGIAGASNMPLGFFIFFATYEMLREEKHVARIGFAMQPMTNGRAH